MILFYLIGFSFALLLVGFFGGLLFNHYFYEKQLTEKDEIIQKLINDASEQGINISISNNGKEHIRTHIKLNK